MLGRLKVFKPVQKPQKVEHSPLEISKALFNKHPLSIELDDLLGRKILDIGQQNPGLFRPGLNHHPQGQLPRQVSKTSGLPELTREQTGGDSSQKSGPGLERRIKSQLCRCPDDKLNLVKLCLGKAAVGALRA